MLKAEQGAPVRAHALISPSAGDRVAYCPASLAISKDAPAEEPSAFAEEGSNAHALCEYRLRTTLAGLGGLADLVDEPTAVPDAFRVADAEMLEAAEGYGRYIRAIAEQAGAVFAAHPVLSAFEHCVDQGAVQFFAVEQRIPVEAVTGEPGGFGTADAVMIVGGEHPELHILDFKYGKGDKVEVKQNVQLSIYALGALAEYDPDGLVYGVETVTLHIVQPRCGGSSRWTVARHELEDGFGRVFRRSCDRALYLYEHPEEVRMAAPFVTRDGEPRGDFADLRDIRAEDMCHWCRARAICPWRAKERGEALSSDFEDLPLVNPTAEQAAVVAELKAIPVPTDPDRLGRAFRYVDMIEQWCSDVRALALRNLQNGKAVPGLKLVAGRPGIRKWADEAAAEKALAGYLKKEDAYELKLISPTKAEKLAKAGKIGERKWKSLQGLVTRAEPKPSVAYEEDPREAVVPQIESDFEDLESGAANG